MNGIINVIISDYEWADKLETAKWWRLCQPMEHYSKLSLRPADHEEWCGGSWSNVLDGARFSLWNRGYPEGLSRSSSFYVQWDLPPYGFGYWWRSEDIWRGHGQKHQTQGRSWNHKHVRRNCNCGFWVLDRSRAVNWVTLWVVRYVCFPSVCFLGQ